MIDVIVIDDEWYNLEETSEIIKETGYFHVAGKYQNPIVALEEVKLTNPQVAFIDIELPEMDGITFTEKLLEINPSIIIVFITSYNQYAVQAFDLNAMDYILKPIKIERFNRMVDKIKNVIDSRMKNTLSLKITCFSHLTVTMDDIPVKWERAKAEELFAYLLMHHGRYVHKERIIEELMPGYEPEKALKILQTSVCKIRNLFSQIKSMVSLEYSGNRYSLFIKGGECDYLQLVQGLDNYKVSDPSTYADVETSCILYKSGFLSEDGYLWSMERDVELKDRLLEDLNEIVNYNNKEDNKDKIIKALTLITKLSPFDEHASYMIIKKYWELGNKQAAFKHYQWLERVLREEYDVEPSDTLKKLIKCMN